MGVAQSSNVAKFTTNIISESLHEIVRQELSNIAQSQILSVTNVGGDVLIQNNHFGIEVEVDIQGVGEAMSDTDNRQSVEQDLTQRAKALVKDINLGSVAQAENLVENYITDTLKITTSLSDICRADITTSQVITVDSIEGNVTFVDNDVVSSVASLTKCTQNAVARSRAVNGLQTALQQSADSEAKGFSIWGLATIAGLIVLGVVASAVLPVVAPMFAAGKYPTLIGLVVLVIGLILLGIWWFTGKTAIKTTLWSKLYATSCPGLVAEEQLPMASADDAAAKCLQDKYAAFDWMVWTYDTDTETYTQLPEPQALFYRQIPEGCSPTQDELPVMAPRKVFGGPEQPAIADRAPRGSVWFSLTEAAYYLKGDVWGPRVSLKSKLLAGLTEDEQAYVQSQPEWTDGTKALIGLSPGQGQDVTVGTRPPKGNVYFELEILPDLYQLRVVPNLAQGQTSSAFSIVGPGKHPGGPDIPRNISGYVYTARNTKFLYPGIGVAALGCVLLLVLSGKQKRKAKATPEAKARKPGVRAEPQ
jgi:hypothetical protein